jgi:hypothetical protein
MYDAATLQRYLRLALRQGLSLGVLASTRRREFALALAAAARCFAEDRTYTEAEVNERLCAWLQQAGAMLTTDHVELRRWLVDNGVLARDGFGRAYSRSVAPADVTAAIEGFGDLDLDAACEQARVEAATVRAERKARWLETHPAT